MSDSVPVQRIRARLSDDTEAMLLPRGTRIRAADDHALTGRIVRWEYHESGTVSPLCYRVEWDDHDRARETRGILAIYATDAGVEPIGAPS